ncbi:MAG: dihydropteroate synthase [Candidatus Dadabacteria bacterium]|nr:MAG: dihydropteroate synthase [Candidatus Dadabacteria bacterium]
MFAYQSVRLGSWQLPDDRAAVMGIINLTPDSFSDGGEIAGARALRERIDQLVEAGADLLDVGAESTRPGAEAVSADEQLRRLEPLFSQLDRISVPVSLDTRDARVARVGIEAGVEIVNDVSMGRQDPELARCVQEAGVVLLLMHSRGTPATMDDCADYASPVEDVVREWNIARKQMGFSAGDSRIWFDPGLGFAKRPEQCWMLLAAIASGQLPRPAPVTVIGASRKRMTAFGARSADQRDPATHAICAKLARPGIVHRVHDVDGAVQAVQAACRLDGALQWS